MKETYFTVTGLDHYYGNDFAERGMTVRLVKEPDNQFDKEAIRAEMDGLGKIGYVANSVRTVIGESYSAGRLYDKIEDVAYGKVLYVMERGLLCVIEIRSERSYREDEDIPF